MQEHRWIGGRGNWKTTPSTHSQTKTETNWRQRENTRERRGRAETATPCVTTRHQFTHLNYPLCMLLYTSTFKSFNSICNFMLKLAVLIDLNSYLITRNSFQITQTFKAVYKLTFLESFHFNSLTQYVMRIFESLLQSGILKFSFQKQCKFIHYSGCCLISHMC